MICSICHESNDFFVRYCKKLCSNPKGCYAVAHFECLKEFYSYNKPGKVIEIDYWCCVSCKSPGRMEYFPYAVVKTQTQLDKIINEILSDRSISWIYCCRCKSIKKSIKLHYDTNISKINDMGKYYMCNDCDSTIVQKLCDICGKSLEKIGDLAKCAECIKEFCWRCKTECDSTNINDHLIEYHSEMNEYMINYQKYFYSLQQKQIKLNEVPDEYQTKELVSAAVYTDTNNIIYVKNISDEFVIRVLEFDITIFRKIVPSTITSNMINIVIKNAKNKRLEIKMYFTKILYEYYTKNLITYEKYKKLFVPLLDNDGSLIRLFYKPTKIMCMIAIKCGAKMKDINTTFKGFTPQEYYEICCYAIKSSPVYWDNINDIDIDFLGNEYYYKLSLAYVTSYIQSLCDIKPQYLSCVQYCKVCSYSLQKDKYSICSVQSRDSFNLDQEILDHIYKLAKLDRKLIEAESLNMSYFNSGSIINLVTDESKIIDNCDEDGLDDIMDDSVIKEDVYLFELNDHNYLID